MVHEVRRGLRQLFDIPMEATANGPAVPGTMLHRVPMDVIDMPVEVGLIEDEIPKIDP